jgi:DNA-binding winged helix-turn-helix (wHTH) protein/tetratricopeptide (TPR) repeat protein
LEDSRARPAEILQVGRYRVCLPTREIFLGEQPIKISWRSFEALQVLIEANGDVVDREALFARLWPGVSVGASSLNQCLAKLRRELGEPSEGGIIETVARRGYRLPKTQEAILSPAVASTGFSSRSARIQQRSVLWVLGAAALVCLVTAFAWVRWSKQEQARSLTAEGFRRVRENRTPQLAEANMFFHRAIELNPTLALAYGGLAEVMARSPDALPEQAGQMAERSIGMDSGCVECRAIAGWILLTREWQFREAEKYLQDAATQKPQDSRILLWHAQMLACAGRLDRAVEEIDRAVRLDSTNPAVFTMRAGILYLSGRYEDAIAAAQQSLGLEPGYSSAYDWIYRSSIRLNRVEEALAARAAAGAAFVGLSADSRYDNEAHWLSAYHVDGIGGLVDAMLSETSTKPALDQMRYDRVMWKMWIGDKEGAMDELEHLFDFRPFHSIYAAVDPVFAPLRGEKRFRQILFRIGIDAVLSRALWETEQAPDRYAQIKVTVP